LDESSLSLDNRYVDRGKRVERLLAFLLFFTRMGFPFTVEPTRRGNHIREEQYGCGFLLLRRCIRGTRWGRSLLLIWNCKGLVRGMVHFVGGKFLGKKMMLEWRWKERKGGCGC
jgi:hypothetical protein